MIEVSSKWVKAILPYKGGGKGLLPVVRWGSLMTHSAGSVTTQSIAISYVMAFEPYRYASYLKQAMAGLPYIKI